MKVMSGVMSKDEATFSDLVNRPSKTVALLERARGHRLLLKRRGDEDLVLVTVGRAEQDAEVTRTATRVLSALVHHSASAELLSDVIMEVFPWVRSLPGKDAPEFARDLVGALRAIEDLATSAPVIQVIAEWRHTAETYADPQVAALLSAGIQGDFGPVEAPPAA